MEKNNIVQGKRIQLCMDKRFSDYLGIKHNKPRFSNGKTLYTFEDLEKAYSEATGLEVRITYK